MNDVAIYSHISYVFAVDFLPNYIIGTRPIFRGVKWVILQKVRIRDYLTP